MKISAFIAAFGVAALLGLPVQAQDAPVKDAPAKDATAKDAPLKDTDRVKAELKKRIPEGNVDAVRKIPYGGLYEVIVGGDIYYTDAKGEILIAGSIIDLKTKENITEARMRQVNAIKWDTLPLDSAIKIVRGNGSRKIAMFEDPNCGYCKRMERDLQGVTDITVYVFLYPILSPDSIEKSKMVWCSADRSKAWIDHMVRDGAITGDAKCDNPVDKILALGQAKRVTGTPTLIFENGDRVPGAIPVAELEKKFAEAKVAANGAAAATAK